uniref:ACB domain-containing protein n=1 Tax=Schistocephalus solidus TaxID=70667 RepID=A0A0X3Q4C6_SCHSO
MFFYVLKKSFPPSWCRFRLLSSVPNTFEEAKLALSKLRKEPDNDIKLKIYALFKQATEGNCTKQRPGRLDFINFAKWQAWSDLGKMTTKVASESYIKLIKQLLESESPSSAASDHAPTSEIDRQVDDTGVMRLTLNRPSKKNAITWTMYEDWMSMLNKAAEDANVKMVVITGEPGNSHSYGILQHLI